MIKVCTKCGAAKLIAEFSVDRSSKSGHRSSCRECEAGRKKAWVEANLEAECEKSRMRMAEWRKSPENRAKAAQATADWKRRNSGKVKEQKRRALERDALRSGRKYKPMAVRRHEADLRRQAAAKRQAARAASRTAGMSDAERYRYLMGNSPAFVINMRMRNGIKKALRGGKGGRRWESLVGYTLDELVEHLQRQMPKGCTLQTIGSGRIHIDHIVPKSAFDVTHPEGLRAAWALANLRPVLAEVNLRKSAKREFLV